MKFEIPSKYNDHRGTVRFSADTHDVQIKIKETRGGGREMFAYFDLTDLATALSQIPGFAAEYARPITVPINIGAVVVSRGGSTYTRVGVDRWYDQTGFRVHDMNIVSWAAKGDIVEVISEGVAK